MLIAIESFTIQSRCKNTTSLETNKIDIVFIHFLKNMKVAFYNGNPGFADNSLIPENQNRRSTIAIDH